MGGRGGSSLALTFSSLTGLRREPEEAAADRGDIEEEQGEAACVLEGLP